MGRSIGWIFALSAWLVWAGVMSAAASGQMLDLTPNLTGSWTPDRGVVHFHVLHRFQVLDPPSRKVINTPTLLLGAGVSSRAMVGVRYASSSLLVTGEPNEWEAYARWSPLSQELTADPAAAVEAGNVRLPDGAAPFDSGDLLPGRDFVHVFQQAGTYEYVCVPHELAGMTGVVVVTADS